MNEETDNTNQQSESKMVSFFHRIGCMLGARWWTGVGVLIVLLGITVNEFRPNWPPLIESGPLNESSFEKLRNSSEVYTVLPDETRENSRAVNGVNLFELKDSSILKVSSNTPDFVIQAATMRIGNDVRILAKGGDGETAQGGGENGRNAGSDCTDGTNGGKGDDGQDGQNGTNILLQVIDLHLSGEVLVDNSGGAGGDGANGSNGGSGGRADRSDRCPGGRGGVGGPGGDGGDGGNGGSLQIQFVNAYQGEKSIDALEVRNLIKYTSKKGYAGTFGAGGSGGSGGSGRGGYGPFGLGGQPGGSRGSEGSKGSPGKNGRPGPQLSVKASIQEDFTP